MSTIINNQCACENKIFSHEQFGWLKYLLSTEQGKPCLMTHEEVKRNSSQQSYTNENISDSIPLDALKGKKVFVDSASEDQKMLDDFKDSLSRNEVKLTDLSSLNDSDPSKMFKQLGDAIGSCGVIITFYNDAPLSWLMQRLRLYQVIHAKDKENKLTIYVCSKKPQPRELPRLASHIDFYWKQQNFIT